MIHEEKGLVKKILPYVPAVGMGIAGVLCLGVAGTQIKEVLDHLNLTRDALNSVELESVYKALEIGAIDLAKDALDKVDLTLIEKAKTNWGVGYDVRGIMGSCLAAIGCFGLSAMEFYNTKTGKRNFFSNKNSDVINLHQYEFKN